MNNFTKQLAIAKAIRKIEEKHGTFLFQAPNNAAARTLSVRLPLERILGSHFFDTPEALAIDGLDAEDEALDGILLFESLKELVVYDSNIGDEFAKHLTRLKCLEQLSLVGTEVTDSGLSALASMGTLRSLVIVDSAVTSAGIEAFKRALPNCEVIDNPIVDPDDPFDIVACYDGFRCYRCSEERSLKAPSGILEFESLRDQVERLKDEGWEVRRTAEGELYVTCPKCSTED